MDFERLKTVLETELPLNRKERFYSATVLPSLLLHKDHRVLFSFLREIPGFPLEIQPETTGNEFLLYTEYNLKESAGNKSAGVRIATKTRDTPDVVIEILQPTRVFVVIEAKMFLNLSQKELDSQMALQKHAVIEKLEEHYDPCRTFHVALVPAQLKFVSRPEYAVVDWQFFTKRIEDSLADNYFLSYLQCALDNYHRSVSDRSSTPSTVEGKKTGTEIYSTRMNLVEAKASIRQEDIRMAVGQLFHYAHLGQDICEHMNKAILLPKKPSLTSLKWLQPLGIKLVWQDGALFRDNAGGQFA